MPTPKLSALMKEKNATSDLDEENVSALNSCLYLTCIAFHSQGHEGQQQRFFLGHSDIVSCLAVHHTEEDLQIVDAALGATGRGRSSPSIIVCSGEIGARPRVCDWCAETCEVCHRGNI